MPNQTRRQIRNHEKIRIEGKCIHLPPPAPIPKTGLAGRDEILTKALAAWTKLDDRPPLHFRLYGSPGVGKNAIVYELARVLKKDVYIINGHNELGAEDIACTATVNSRNMIEYVASPLFAGMYHGGIVFFDEIGKASSSALDPLASVLDDRRELASVLAGVQIKAHEDFLFCAALNDTEEEGAGLPSFLDERTRPAIKVGYPPLSELTQILEMQYPTITERWFSVLFSEFDAAHLSPRRALTLLGYANRLYKAQHRNSQKPAKKTIRHCLRQALDEVAPIDTGDPAAHEDDQSEFENSLREDIEEVIDENDDSDRTPIETEGPIH